MEKGVDTILAPLVACLLNDNEQVELQDALRLQGWKEAPSITTRWWKMKDY